MLLADYQIDALAQEGMISPYLPELVGEVDIDGVPRQFGPPSPESEYLPVISFGLSSYGYDIRLSPEDFRIFHHVPGTVVDPKNFNPANLERSRLHSDRNGEFFVLPAHSYALGVAMERLSIPGDISVLCVGKSTYARVGIIANLTPAEAGWRGYLTLEFSNSSSADCRIYANEGVVQLIFLRGEPCRRPYGERSKNKYQDQRQEVTLSKI